MDQIDPLALVAVGLLTALILSYAVYLKVSIRRLDRRIAEREAAGAVNTPSTTTR